MLLDLEAYRDLEKIAATMGMATWPEIAFDAVQSLTIDTSSIRFSRRQSALNLSFDELAEANLHFQNWCAAHAD